MCDGNDDSDGDCGVNGDGGDEGDGDCGDDGSDGSGHGDNADGNAKYAHTDNHLLPLCSVFTTAPRVMLLFCSFYQRGRRRLSSWPRGEATAEL